MSEEITISMVPADGGRVPAAQFRVGLAVAITMLADAVREQSEVVPVALIDQLAAAIIAGEDQGLSFVAAHCGRMANIRITKGGE